MVWIASLLLLLLVGSSARAEEVPRFDIQAMCRAAPQLEAGDKNTDQSCVRDETQARDQLRKQWASYDVRKRSMCVQETNVGGSPSYVDVLTCIEMGNGNPSAVPARRARRNP